MRVLRWLSFAAVVLSGSTVAQLVVDSGRATEDVGQLSGNATAGDHTNNWAVLVCASRFWFNYRHMANTLGMYRTVKRLGIPDSHIILMLADDVACNARNSYPAKVYANSGRQMDLYGESIEVDYRGYEVTVESFLRLLTGRTNPDLPPSKRLLTDASSNVFVYLTGHGGNEFLKFQDNEEISAFDVADAIEQMWEKRRYNKLLFMIDTCEANTMYSKIYSPNVISTGSSRKDESSYAHHADPTIGVSVIDSFTHHILQYLERLTKASRATMADFFATYDPVAMRSHPGIETSMFPTPPEQVLITDFFGGVANVEVLPKTAELDAEEVSPDAFAVPIDSHGQDVRGSLPALEKTTVPISQDTWQLKSLIHAANREGRDLVSLFRDVCAWAVLLSLAGLSARWGFRIKSEKLDLTAAPDVCADTSPRDWSYRSEGGAHSVYAYSGQSNAQYTGKLLRLPKVREEAADLADMDELLDLWRKKLLPRLVPQDSLPSSITVELRGDWACELEQLTAVNRPQHRKEVDSSDSVGRSRQPRPALLIEDLVGAGGLAPGDRVFVAEIKPKWGFMPKATHLSPPQSIPIKTKHCRYCLHQHMRDRATATEHYCPLDLYSREESRVEKALRGLWDSWRLTGGEGNNWRVFIDGKRLQVENLDSLLSLFPLQVSTSPVDLASRTRDMLVPALSTTPVFPLLKKLQHTLDPFDISHLAEQYRAEHPTSMLFDPAVVRPMTPEEVTSFVEVRMDCDPSTWSLRERLVAYTLSATFKDCSIFVRLVLRPLNGGRYELVPGQGTVKVIDLDLKSMNKLAKWAELDETIWRAWETSSDTASRQCVA